jgi:16S rRNA pseudouridine516 synthase
MAVLLFGLVVVAGEDLQLAGKIPFMNLTKLLQSQGFGTRRACRGLILGGRVVVEGEVISDPEAELPTAGLVFSVDGETWQYREKAYVMLHKPPGYECSRQPRHHPSVLSLLPPPLVERGIQPVGRLDEDTTGLLLLTDDGAFLHSMSSAKKRVPKVYRATTKHAITDGQISSLLNGVLLNDETERIAAAHAERLDEHLLRLTVTGGQYHQVKRMIAASGNRVEVLHRESVGDLVLPDDLAPGEWRWLDLPRK